MWLLSWLSAVQTDVHEGFSFFFFLWEMKEAGAARGFPAEPSRAPLPEQEPLPSGQTFSGGGRCRRRRLHSCFTEAHAAELLINCWGFTNTGLRSRSELSYHSFPCNFDSELRPGEVHQRDNKVLKKLRYDGGTDLL